MKTNMKIGSLYTVKKFSWLLFPTKETALAAPTANRSLAGRISSAAPAAAPVAANYWSNQYNCEVTYFSPDSYIVFLEQEDGICKKVLTSDGRIGWTWFKEEYNDCFEEVKSE